MVIGGSVGMMKKNIVLRIVVWIIILGMLAAFVVDFAFAQVIPSTPPQNLRVSDIGYESEAGQNWFAGFSWNLPTYPPEATKERSQTFYFNRIERGSGKIINDVAQITLGNTSTSFTTSGYGIELDHGTIYELYGTSSYTYGEFGEYTFTSGKSNRVKFLTHLEFGAELISGTNEIKIVWDDVWDTDGRIDYRILISDTSGFTQPPSIPDIIGSQIGTENSKVTVSGGRLEYIYTNALPGREYSIKVIPLVNTDVASIPEEELPVVRVKTEILLRAKKMGETSDGVRWMLFWDPIIKGSIGSTTFTRVEYKLYRHDKAGNATFFALVIDRDRFEMILKPEDVEKYTYSIEAVAYKPDGSSVPFYSSTKVALVEQIPEYPTAPEFVKSFPTADPAPLVFDDLLTSNSATLLWRVPVSGDGKIDTEVYYDLYLVDKIEEMNTLPVTKRIATNLTMTRANEVRELETGRLIGYRYTINNLDSNSIYYAVLIAKKNFIIESEDGFMVSRPYTSDPAIKVIITRPDTEMDKPLAPPSPPFRLKPGEDSIGKNEIIMQLEKSWLEMYHSGLKKWLYVVNEDDPERGREESYYNENNSFDYDDYIENQSLPDGDENKKPERKVEYPAGWQVNIHCVEYDQALQIVKSVTGRDFVSYSDMSRNYILSLQKQIEPVLVPDLDPEEWQAFALPIRELDPNTTYLVWVTVSNSTGLLESDPSDPLLVTTLPDFPPAVETPVVPTDLKGIAADTYVDLFWSYLPGYSYNISYATEDDRTKAAGTITVSYEQLRYEPSYRIGALKANTVYYFWIQALSPAETGGFTESDWSNSIAVRTEPYSPPPKPRGFGVKDTHDAITETSIFYEWLPDESVTFILEISENAGFSDSVEYNIDGSEYQVTGLKSNYRYFARLYSYSADTGLRSEPSHVVMVITRKGRGEYDADVPLDDIPVGDMLIIDAIAIDGIWNAKAVDVNAHRLSEKIRQSGTGVFSVDLMVPPPATKIIRLELGGEVLETLAGTSQTLIVRTPGFDIYVFPGCFLQDTYFRLKQSHKNISLRIDVRSNPGDIRPENNMRMMAPITEMEIYAGHEESFFLLEDFIKPVKVILPVENDVEADKIKVRHYDSVRLKWDDVDYTWIAPQQKFAAYPKRSGAIAAAAIKPAGITAGSGIEQTLKNILSRYQMPSIPAGNQEFENELTVSEGIKHLMDIIPYEYENGDVTEKALRAGLLLPETANGNALLSKEEAAYAAVAVYRRKTGQNIPDSTWILEQIPNASEIRPQFRAAVAFALSNGIIPEGDGMFLPKIPITRSELFIIIENILIMAGEI